MIPLFRLTNHFSHDGHSLANYLRCHILAEI
jgi:hypothetical protein